MACEKTCKTYSFNVSPIAKPRMTRSDKWKNPPRPAIAKYRAFADELRYTANLAGFELPGAYSVTFYLPIPKSRRREILNEKPHLQVPDIDNLVKSLNDVLCPNGDAHIWHIVATKRWSKRPRIEISEIKAA